MKANDKTSVSVEIYGTRYRLLADSVSSASYVTMVAAHVNERMTSIASQHPRLDMSRLAVLAAINIADDLLKTQEQQERASAVSIEKKNQELAELRERYDAAVQELHAVKAERQSLETRLEEVERKLLEAVSAPPPAQQQTGERALREEYEKLQQEYAKLQREFNEWIELTEEELN